MTRPRTISPWKMTLALLLGLMLTQAALAAEGHEPSDPKAVKDPDPTLLQELKAYPHKIVFEALRGAHFDLIQVNADGSNPVNLTNTPDEDELYPKVSPDGKLIAFYADSGKSPGRARTLYVMNADGTGRKKIADGGREPCWSADGKQIAFLKSEFKRLELSDYATQGIYIYDLASGQTTAHPNAAAIKHLYCLNWTRDGNWFVATVHGGMNFSHAIVAIPAKGDQVYNLKLSGCRPDVSPDGKHVSWGNGDYKLGVADLDFSGPEPKAKRTHDAVTSKDPMKTYHADWSPDGHYIAFSYGDKLEGKTIGGVPEIPGVKAPGWNICVADTTQPGRWVMITNDGASCKEPDWAPAGAAK